MHDREFVYLVEKNATIDKETLADLKEWRALYFEFQNKNAVDEEIRNTNFHCIASNCKYFNRKFVLYTL